MRFIRLAFLLASFLVLGACGGTTSADDSSNQAFSPTGSATLPPPSQLKEIMAPNVSEGLGDIGSASFIDPCCNAVVAEGLAEFAPDAGAQGLEHWAYAAYTHYVDPAILAETGITFEPVWLGDAPEDAYIGIANWTKDRWEFTHLTPDEIAPDLLGGDGPITDYLSQDDENILVIVFVDGPEVYTLEALEFGNPAWDYWTHTWGTPGYDFIVDATCDDDDNIYLLGQTTNYGGSDMDLMLLKVTEAGVLDWAKLYGGAGLDEAKAICYHANSLYVVGDTKPNGKDFVDILMQKWSLDGTLQASYSWGGDYDDKAETILANANGVYIGGYTYDPIGEGNQDCDSVLIKLNLEFDSVVLACSWGGRDWESVRSLCAPPDLTGEGRVCVGEVANDAGYFTGDSKIGMSVWNDEGCLGRHYIHWAGYGSAEVKTATPGPGTTVYAGGLAQTDDFDAVPVQLVYTFDSDTTIDPPQLVQHTSIWRPREPYRADVTGLAYDAGKLYIAGNMGYSAWPDFEWYPTMFVSIDATFPALGAAWGDGNADNACQGSLLLPSGAIAVVGTGTNAEGRWHSTIGEALSLAAIVDVFDATPTHPNHVLVPQAVTPQDIFDDLDSSVDHGAGLMEAMLDVILSMGATTAVD